MEIKREDNEKLWQAMRDYGELEKGEHLKHSYCDAEIVLVVKEYYIQREPVLSPYLGMKVVLTGIWDYNDGFESNDDIIRIFPKVLVEVPEQVIPAYTREVWEIK